MNEVTLLSVVGALAAAIIALIMGARAKNAENKASGLQNLLDTVMETARRSQEAQGMTAEAGEKANEERKDLAGTADSDLADRANNLFRL